MRSSLMNMLRCFGRASLGIWFGMIVIGLPLGESLSQEPLPAPSPAAAPDPAPEPKPEAAGDESEEELPLFEDVPWPPTYDELMNDPPVDWVVLKTEKAFVIEPIFPRPHFLEKRQDDIAATFQLRGKENPQKPGQVLTGADVAAKVERLEQVEVLLPGDETYYLPLRFIDRIIYHEDQVLARVDRLLAEQQVDKATELLIALRFRIESLETLERKGDTKLLLNPHYGTPAAELTPRQIREKWPKFSEAEERLLFVEAETTIDENPERALVCCEQLHGLNAGFLGLSRVAGRAADRLIEAAIARKDFRHARTVLKRLTSLWSDHPEAVRRKDELLSQAAQAMETAATLRTSGRLSEAVDAVTLAARIWPQAPGLSGMHRSLLGAYPRIRSSVVGTGDANFPFLTVAARRVASLTDAPLFEVERIDGDFQRFGSRYLSRWEPRDLGRILELQLREHPAFWNAAPLLTAYDLGDGLSQRLDPGNRHFDTRAADFVQRVEVEGPYRATIVFDRVPLSHELLLTSILRDPSEQLGKRFNRAADAETEGVLFRRCTPGVSNVGEQTVAEVLEFPHADYESALRTFLRGHAFFLPDVTPADAATLAATDRYEVRKLALPATHLLQIHPDSALWSQRELRLALYHGVDRAAVIAKHFNGRQTAASELIPTSPVSRLAGPAQFARDGRLVAAAMVLAAAAEREEELPRLRLIADPDPIISKAAAELVAQYQRIGLKVELVDPDATEWDLAFRTVVATGRFEGFRDVLMLPGEHPDEGLRHVPDWLRRLLLEIDYVSNPDDFDRLRREFADGLRAEAAIIPLWNIDRFCVAYRFVQHIPNRPTHVYQDVERWSMTARDLSKVP